MHLHEGYKGLLIGILDKQIKGAFFFLGHSSNCGHFHFKKEFLVLE